MQAAFQEIVLQLALSGLVVALVAMPVCAAFRRLRTQCRALNALNWTLAAPFLLVALTVGGTKTNGVNNLPPQHLTLPRQTLQMLNTLPPAGGAVNLADPVQVGRAAAYAADWNVCGAWKDSFWLPFADGWVFPWGTNHLSGVEVVSYGRLWPTPFDTNAVASAGAPFEIVPGLTSFAYELTPSNSYRFSWINAAISRDTNDLVSAVLELFRNGDRSVTTNGVTAYLPRELPFAHDGFGQDAEWVAANFTNATEIAAAGGYAAWVDAQVGTGLTNGLYKLTVTVPDDPLETTQITVGDLSVAVTNAGEYVFLLGKCIDYPLAVFPETATNFIYTAVDDIAPASSGTPLLGAPPGGWWSSDEQVVAEIVVPYAPLTPFSPVAHIKWNATLAVSPRAWFPTTVNPSEMFTAVLDDVPVWLAADYAWSSSHPAKVSIAAPAAQTTEMTWLAPDAFDDVLLSLSVTVGSDVLHAYFYPLDEDDPVSWTWHGTMVKVDTPATLFINNDDDDAAGGVDYFQEVHAANDEDVVRGRFTLSSDNLLEGTFSLDAITGMTNGYMPDLGVYTEHDGTGALTENWSRRVNGVFNQEIYLNPSEVSSAYRGSSIRVTWTPDHGDPIPFLRRFTVVEPIVEPVCNATTNVVENGVAHTYTVNPCGVVVGREAYFRIEVAPADYPDSEIVWDSTTEGVVEFVGGNTGRQVTVRGLVPGETQLAIQIGDSRSAPPEFPVNVVTNMMVNLKAWIIEDAHEHLRSVEPADIRQMVKDANDIYAQVGVTLNLVEPIVITNIPDAYNAFYVSPTNATTRWSFDRIVNIASGTGGLECYFINSFVDSSHIKAAHTIHGIVLTSRATQHTLAHEIGHAFGMDDIYVTNANQKEDADPLLHLLASEKASHAHLTGDWNGGCRGHGSGGTRYYRSGMSMKEIVGRMLMLGVVPKEDVRRDITAGDIYGVYYTEDDNQIKNWHKNNAPVGFPWSSRSAVHQ